MWEYQQKFRALQRDNREDLLQECLTHWYFKRPRYDPSLSVECKTYMSRVIENNLMDIVRRNERLKRKPFFQSVSLDELISRINEEECRDQVITDEEGPESMFKADFERVLLNALKKLSRRQKELCRLIKDEGLNFNEVSKELNIPRATLYDEILRIRDVFKNEGLKDYL